MISTTQISPMWAALPESLKVLAAKADAEIVASSSTFGVVVGGDLLAHDFTVDQLDNFLQGYVYGQDRYDVPGLVSELAKAEQIIQTLTANMSDGQRTKAANSLEAAGFPPRHTSRCKERQELIAEVRGMLSGAAA